MVLVDNTLNKIPVKLYNTTRTETFVLHWLRKIFSKIKCYPRAGNLKFILRRSADTQSATVSEEAPEL